MTLFWAQVALILLGTFFHCLGRVYELRYRQRRHYLAKWGEEFDRALEEAAALSLLGKHQEANVALARASLVTHKYTLFFRSIN